MRVTITAGRQRSWFDVVLQFRQSFDDRRHRSGRSLVIRRLVAGQEAVVRTARAAFAAVEAAHDEPTADLLTQRMQVHEKNAWMLRSLLEG